MDTPVSAATIPGELRWRAALLKDVADIGAGNSAPQKKESFEDGRYPFIRTSDVGQIRFGVIDGARDLLNDKGISGLRLVPSGTVLMPKSGASTFLNHRVVMSGDGYVSSHLATITARHGIAEPRYLLYYLSTVKAQNLIQDHKYPSLTLATIGGISIPLPPLEEQKRIVAALDQDFAGLDRACAHAEVNLADSIEILDATLHTIFHKDLAKSNKRLLPDVCIHFGRGKSKHRPRNDPELYGGDVPFIQTGDISDATHLIESYSQTYSEKGLAQSKLWPKGTICIAIVGATIGETGILGFDACFPDSVIGLRPDPSVCDTRYVEFMLHAFKGELKEAGKGSARDNINLATFENAKFPFPTLKQQVAVVEKLDDIAKETETLRANYKRALVDLADLRQSLLQKTFAGELT